MEEKRDVQELYDRLMEYEQGQHEQNQKRIKTGIILLWVIPLVFLSLLFITNSSKPIFLTMWIVSLFALAIYLILTEYNDYKLQEKMNEINGRESKIKSLMPVEEVEERVIAATEKIEERVESHEQARQERREEILESVTEKKAQATAVVAAKRAKRGGKGTKADDQKTTEGGDGE